MQRETMRLMAVAAVTLPATYAAAGPCDFDGGGVGTTGFLQLLANRGPCP